MNKKLIKISGFILAAVLIVIFAALAAAKLLITPERVRRTVIPLAEKALNRPVSIGEIDVRLFSGVAIKDFAVRSKDGQGDFIAADALVLDYQFWPLLALRVVLDEARLEGPRIRVVRSENGEFNFGDLVAGHNPAAEPAPAEKQTNEPSGEGPVIDLVINEMTISDGDLRFIDRSPGKAPREFRLQHLGVFAEGISLDQAFPISLEALIDKAPVRISANINPKTAYTDAQITLKDFDVTSVLAYVAGDIPGEVASMRLNLDVALQGDASALTSSGKITFEQVDLKLDALPEAPLENAVAGLAYDLSVDVANNSLSIRKAEVSLNAISLSVTGAIDRYATQPDLNLRADLPRTELAAIARSVPEKLLAPLMAMNPAGRIGAEFHLAGSPEQLDSLIKKGEIAIDDVRLTSGNLPVAIDGRVSVEADTARAKGLKLQLADSPAALDFTAVNLTGTPVRLTHTLNASNLNIDQILAAGSEKRPEPPSGTPGKGGDRKPPKTPEPTGPIDLPLTVDGIVRVGNAIYSGLELTDFELLYRLENNIFTVSRIRGDMAGGTITGTGQADLNSKFINYEADMSIEGTQTDPIISAVYPPAAKTLFGNLFLNFKLNGSGIALDSLLQSLTGNADLKITDGRLTGTGLTKGLAAFLEAEKLEVLQFNSISGDVQLEKGKFKIDSSYMGNDLRMFPKGTIGLDGSVNLSLNMRLAPDLAARVDGNELVSRLLKNQEGWAVIPINVAGSLTSPRFLLDSNLVRQMLQQKATEALQQQIREKLLKSDNAEPAPPSGQKPTSQKKSDTPESANKPEQEKGQPSVEQILEESLKKLIK